MTQQEFEELSKKYVQGQCSSEEILRLEAWLVDVTNSLEQTMLAIGEDELLQSKIKTWHLIQSDLDVLSTKKRSITKRLRLKLVTCAFVLLLIANIIYFKILSRETVSNSHMKVVGIESINVGNAPQQILLPDSSTVILEIGSSLIVDENFGKICRIVQLSGGAFFSIRSNKTQPFLVYTDDLITEVLGTSFSILPEKKNNKIEVSVVTGKVSVYTNGREATSKRDGVIVAPNHKIVYDTELKKLRHDLVDDPQIISRSVQKKYFDFNDTTLDSALQLMEELYGIDIMVVNPLLKECKITGNLDGLDMYSQLEFMCEILGATYELRGSTIFILGSGCS